LRRIAVIHNPRGTSQIIRRSLQKPGTDKCRNAPSIRRASSDALDHFSYQEMRRVSDSLGFIEGC
jgi:hypothetical protein